MIQTFDVAWSVTTIFVSVRFRKTGWNKYNNLKKKFKDIYIYVCPALTRVTDIHFNRVVSVYTTAKNKEQGLE